MNVDEIASKASNAVNSATSNAANKAASNVNSNLISGTSALKPDIQEASNNITQFPGNNKISQNINQSDNIIDFPGNNKSLDNVIDFSGNNNSSEDLLDPGNSIENNQNKIQEPKNDNAAQNQNSQNDDAYQARSNQNLGPGKKIDENGNVENTGSRKAVEAIGRGVAAYATGGESIGKEDLITKNPVGDAALGVVADTVDKVPLAGDVLNDLGESGLADGVNDALDTYGKAKNGDIKGTIDSAKKTVGDVEKTLKHYGPKIILGAVATLFPIIMVCVVIGAICGPVLGGFMDATNAIGEYAEGLFLDGDPDSGEHNPGDPNPGSDDKNRKTTEQLISEVPGFDSLSATRKAIVTAAASGVASGKPYLYGGKPTGPGLSGLPSSGVDCSGFVQWALWTGTGSSPGTLSTSTIISQIGSSFTEISKSELKPGDIALKHKGSGANHTAIYAGNNQWFHAANKKSGIIRSGYSSFTVYLRYKGVD